MLQKVIHIYVGLRNLIVMVKVGSGWSNPHGKWKKWPAVQKRTAVFSVSWVRDFQTVDYKSVRLFTIRSIFFRICFPWFDIMVLQPQIYCNTMSLLKHLQEFLTKPLIIYFQVCSKLLSHSDLPNDSSKLYPFSEFLLPNTLILLCITVNKNTWN